MSLPGLNVEIERLTLLTWKKFILLYIYIYMIKLFVLWIQTRVHFRYLISLLYRRILIDRV